MNRNQNSCTGHSVWNSGKIISTQSQLVSVPETGFSVEPTYTYLWRVRVWDETDTPSQWSREAVFHIVPDDLAAGQWIGAITRQEARLPQGRNFHGSELKNPEVKSAWEAVDTLAKRSICRESRFVRTGPIKKWPKPSPMYADSVFMSSL